MSKSDAPLKAVLQSAVCPDEVQKQRFLAFLEKKYHTKVELIWEKVETGDNGFCLRVGAEVYDWSVKGRFEQFREELQKLSETSAPVIPLLKNTINAWMPESLSRELGEVISVGDGIAMVKGLEKATYGEILVFPGGVKGMVQELGPDGLGCILFGEDDEVYEGARVLRTGRTAGIPVGEGFLGRVVDALGSPIDGMGEIVADGYRPVESPAPGIIDRSPVNRPMETGLLTIDSMFPIGRGQRELIIGDRQTGKTAIALDTIVNQKGKGVICIYVAIGQKNSSVAQIADSLQKRGCMEYSIIVSASASDAVPLQYIAPYAGCSLGEYFMEKGRDVLIVYDDLSKHAIAYRALSLLLERSPGREAFPGDVFYLHSRLLERAARLSEAKGGGSMTALPIVETQAGDVSAYIPTNIISITDGQIFLESDLFFSGQRPAVNVGLSVSRVGGSAQTKAMKKASGSIRLDLAQYREMEIFNQFSSDLDEMTKNQIAYGQGLMRLLRQPQYHPMRQFQQVLTLLVALDKCYMKIPVDQVQEMNQRVLRHLEEQLPEICQRIQEEGEFTQQDREELLREARQFIAGTGGV